MPERRDVRLNSDRCDRRNLFRPSCAVPFAESAIVRHLLLDNSRIRFTRARRDRRIWMLKRISSTYRMTSFYYLAIREKKKEGISVRVEKRKEEEASMHTGRDKRTRVRSNWRNIGDSPGNQLPSIHTRLPPSPSRRSLNYVRVHYESVQFFAVDGERLS